jgi:hypothetical protein
MINENKLEYEDMTVEELADYHLNEAVEHAKTTLLLNENCYRKFGKQMLSDIQKSYFEKLASGILPTDEEQIEMNVETVKQAHENEKRRKAELGEAYVPTLAFEDKTEGFAIN